MNFLSPYYLLVTNYVKDKNKSSERFYIIDRNCEAVNELSQEMKKTAEKENVRETEIYNYIYLVKC